MTGGAVKVGTLFERRSVRLLLALLIVLRRRERESVGEAMPDWQCEEVCEVARLRLRCRPCKDEREARYASSLRFS